MVRSFKVGLSAALLCTLLHAAPAFAQLASRPMGEDAPESSSRRGERRGIFLGLAADGGAQFSTGLDTRFGYGGQAKLGFSFNRRFQLYLAGAVHNASYSPVDAAAFSQQLILATAHLRNFLYLDRSGVGVYYDAGIGVGFASPGFGPTRATGIGLGYSGGFGVEIPLGAYFSLAPEFYYRSVQSASSDNGFTGSINVIGLQLGVVYY